MIGIKFDELGSFGLSFQLQSCRLDHSSFFGLDLRHCKFEDCRLWECDFADANLTGVSIQNCDLSNAHFEGSNLMKSVWRGSFNLAIDPRENQLAGARFSKDNAAGLLSAFKIVIEDA